MISLRLKGSASGPWQKVTTSIQYSLLFSRRYNTGQLGQQTLGQGTTDDGKLVTMLSACAHTYLAQQHQDVCGFFSWAPF